VEPDSQVRPVLAGEVRNLPKSANIRASMKLGIEGGFAIFAVVEASSAPDEFLTVSP
jgi:hypothetical protein